MVYNKYILNKKIYDTAVIGAGAAGLMAAITAARLGMRTILLEHMDEPAKKILATGNGKCNFTNIDQNPENYYCEDSGFVGTVLAQFAYRDTVQFFQELGIEPLQKNGTCIYPESEQASSLRSALLAEIQRLEIPLVTALGIRSIKLVSKQEAYQKKQPGRMYVIQAKDQEFYSDTCILATGGKSAKKTGSDGSGYVYATQLGHSLSNALPALVPLQADYKQWKLPAGVRSGVMVQLFIDGKRAAQECGELQITDYGISGIVIFQLSRFVSRALAEQKKVQICLDFKPNLSIEELEQLLSARFKSVYHVHKTVRECLLGFLPDKLIPVILNRAKTDTGMRCKACRHQQVENIARQLKNFAVPITGTKNFDASQVTTGGIPVQEIDACTMESKIVPGLYFAGEIVDVDAKCGGYNLQWAWSSGYTAAKAATHKILQGKHQK